MILSRLDNLTSSVFYPLALYLACVPVESGPVQKGTEGSKKSNEKREKSLSSKLKAKKALDAFGVRISAQSG